MITEQGAQQRPLWTLSESAQHCSVSRSTVRRYRETGKFPNAVKDPERGWIVPVGDLLAAGLRPGRSAPLSEHAQSKNGPAHDLAQRIQQLETQLTVERAQRAAVEQVAAERERSLTDLRAALRMLEAGPTRPEPTSAVPVVPPGPEPTPSVPPAARPRWWQRKEQGRHYRWSSPPRTPPGAS